MPKYRNGEVPYSVVSDVLASGVDRNGSTRSAARPSPAPPRACFNEGIPIEVPDDPNGIVICGPCGNQILGQETGQQP